MARWIEKRNLLTIFVFRMWYRIVNKLDKKGELVFMNYGYCDNTPIEGLHHDNEGDRTCIQLYDQLVKTVDVNNLKILEVGSGRGGGLSYISNRYNPQKATGLDLDPSAVNFCNEKHGHEQLTFIQGNAESLPFEDNSMDVIINVESSHRYGNMNNFLAEVKRVLRPEGSFLMTDFRYNERMDQIRADIKSSGLELIENYDITNFVVNALEKDDPRRKALIDRVVPALLRKQALNFAGAVGSNTYNCFADGKWQYFNYHLKKSS